MTNYFYNFTKILAGITGLAVNKQSDDLPVNPDPYAPDTQNENIFTRILNEVKAFFKQMTELLKKLFQFGSKN